MKCFRLKPIITKLIIILAAGAMLLPIVVTFIQSLNGGIKPYADFFLWKPMYLKSYVNSIAISGISSILSVVGAVLAAYVFAKKKFPFRNLLFFMYVVVMMMPFQVTLLPQYIVSKKFEIFDTYGALILPAIFAPFAVFYLTQIIKSVGNDTLEAASLDTSSELVILFKILIPNIRPGIAAAFVLSFAETWNMIEQPLILLDDKNKYPLSVMFRNIAENDNTIIFAASIMALVIPLLLFAFFQDELIDNIGAYGLDK
ncbi:sugar ABC transporter permease [Clostridia bacterium]|nr:sugar ABC transporter permease [Clostridia bacterium]